jgi:hypothetical protein
MRDRDIKRSAEHPEADLRPFPRRLLSRFASMPMCSTGSRRRDLGTRPGLTLFFEHSRMPRPNNALERTGKQCGLRLAAARSLWPAVQLNR